MSEQTHHADLSFQIARSCDVAKCVDWSLEPLMVLCSHRADIKVLELPEAVDGCEECVVAGSDGARECHGSSGHAIIRSLEPGEEWAWCYIDRVGMLTPEVTGATRIPPSPLGSHLERWDRKEPR